MILVVSHDAGGAEILSSYVRREKVSCIFSLSGPSKRIFERKLGPIELIGLEDGIPRASTVLCGSSWQSDLEWNAIRLAREAGRRCVTYLDHWINYRERFVRAGSEHLPDEVWVGDEYAARIARDCFGGLPIRLVPNPYLDDLKIEVEILRKNFVPAIQCPSVLYVCEPVKEHALLQYGDERHLGYVEEEALKYFLAHTGVIAPEIRRFVIRKHPSEPPEKYSWAAQSTYISVEFSQSENLIDDIAAADVVVGCESMAMIVAMLAGRRVITTIPPGGRSCVLPYVEVESLVALIESASLHAIPANDIKRIDL